MMILEDLYPPHPLTSQKPEVNINKHAVCLKLYSKLTDIRIILVLNLEQLKKIKINIPQF